MTLAYQSLLMLVLLVTGAVAALPVLLRESTHQLSPPLRSGLIQPGLWIVETPQGWWYLNGRLQNQRDIERFLRRNGGRHMVHYLPSNALPIEKVSRSLRWLRRLVPGAVVLELPPVERPAQ
jgi:hypothetical protein